MNTVEKRDYIHSHLHQIEASVIDELFNKIHTIIDETNDEMSEELKSALDKGIESLSKGESSKHEDVMLRMKKKYPKLIK